MTTIAFRANEEVRKQLEAIAKNKGINLSAVIKLYLTQGIKSGLNEITINGMTVAEELELLAQAKDGGTGEIYDNVEDFIKSLDEDKDRRTQEF